MAKINGYKVKDFKLITNVDFEATLCLNENAIGKITGWTKRNSLNVTFEKSADESALKSLLPELNGRYGVHGEDLESIESFIIKIMSLDYYEEIFKQKIKDEDKEFLVEKIVNKGNGLESEFLVLKKEDFFLDNPYIDNINYNGVYEKFVQDDVKFRYLNFYTALRHFDIVLPTDEEMRG